MATLKKSTGSRSKKKVVSASALNKDSIDTTVIPQSGEQQRMVSEAAYYRAMSRNFDGGNPVEDWLEAEREIATKLIAE